MNIEYQIIRYGSDMQLNIEYKDIMLLEYG